MAEHKDLTDPYLHEPKGTSEAFEGEVYVANGAGSGEYKRLPINFVDFTKTIVTDLIPSSIEQPIILNGTGLLQDPTGNMEDTQYDESVQTKTIDSINKNFKELYTFTLNSKKISEDTKEAIDNIEKKLNMLIDALQVAGIV